MDVLVRDCARAVVWLALVAFGLLPAAAWARTVEDLSRPERIVLTLGNSISEQYQYQADDLEQLAQRPDFYIDEPEGIYSFSFRLKEAEHPQYGRYDGSGYYKIDVPRHYRDPEVTEGWEPVKEPSETPVKVWFREVRESSDESFNEVRAFLNTGNLVFTVSLRRSVQEPPGEARDVALARLDKIIENAKRYGLLSRVVIELVGETEPQSLDEGAVANYRVERSGETRVRMRVRAEDYEGRPLDNVAYFTVSLKGDLARFARIEEALFNEKEQRYEVHFPRQGVADVTLVMPAADNEEFAEAIDANDLLTEDFGITLEADVVLKPKEQASLEPEHGAGGVASALQTGRTSS